MKNEHIDKTYTFSDTIFIDWDNEEETLDDNWLVSGSDLFNGFDDSEETAY